MSQMVKKSENLEKSQKIAKNHLIFFLFIYLFYFFIFFAEEKKCYPLSFPILGGRDSTRALQCSPFQISGGVVQAGRRRKENFEENPHV